MKHYRKRDTRELVTDQEVRNWFMSERSVTPPSAMTPSVLEGTPYIACKSASSVDYDRQFQVLTESWRTDQGGWEQQVITVENLPMDAALASVRQWLSHKIQKRIAKKEEKYLEDNGIVAYWEAKTSGTINYGGVFDKFGAIESAINEAETVDDLILIFNSDDE